MVKFFIQINTKFLYMLYSLHKQHISNIQCLSTSFLSLAYLHQLSPQWQYPLLQVIHIFCCGAVHMIFHKILQENRPKYYIWGMKRSRNQAIFLIQQSGKPYENFHFIPQWDGLRRRKHLAAVSLAVTKCNLLKYQGICWDCLIQKKNGRKLCYTQSAPHINFWTVTL